MMGRLFILLLFFSDSVSAQVQVDSRSISPIVAVVDLKVPRNARREFDKANEFMAKQNWTKAIEKLHQATTIYPDYADAYNNLAVVYGHLGDQIRAREALEKAINVNDHLVLAYVNLARMKIAMKDFPGAEILLQEASTLDPTDVITLTLLAYAQLMDQRPDEAIATCYKAHSRPHAPALVHRIAARALERKNQMIDAIAELQLFLNEEQLGPSAESARKELATLQSLSHNSPRTVAAECRCFHLCSLDRCVLP
jgi:tetratricopeptide (TPR) repeat protein